jgi:hypothetical protein
MDKKADKMDKKIMGMLKYIEQQVKYVELLVKEPTAGYTEKYKDIVVSIPLLTTGFTQHAWHQIEKIKEISPLNQNITMPSQAVYSSCLCSIRIMVIL